MRKIQYLIILSIILLLNCCNNPTEPSKILKILPLNEGNIWVYQEYLVKGKDSLVKYEIDTIRVLSDTIVNDLRFYYVNYLGSVYDFGYLNDSLNGFVDPNHKFVKPFLLYSYPCKTGDFYLSNFGMCVVKNIDTTITVQAGTFKCIKYKFYVTMGGGNGFEDYHYCSPGVGLIKIEHFVNSYSQQDIFIKNSEKELINYNLIP